VLVMMWGLFVALDIMYGYSLTIWDICLGLGIAVSIVSEYRLCRDFETPNRPLLDEQYEVLLRQDADSDISGQVY
jgi:hypothetical protein